MKNVLAASMLLSVGVLIGVLFVGVPHAARGGEGPLPASRNGDVNGDGFVNVSDPVYLLVYLFRRGESPVACADSPDLVDRVKRLEMTMNDLLGDLAAPCEETLDRFVDNGDGTLTDRCTGLMWLSADANNHFATNWNDAQTLVENLESAQYADWRLPTVWEVYNLLWSRQAMWNGSAVHQGFNRVAAAGFPTSIWTSTEVSVTHAWRVTGNGDIFAVQKSESHAVRAVRDPQQ